MGFGNFFRSLGSLLKRALKFAADEGVTDVVMMIALNYVKDAAATQFENNALRREWAVEALQQRTGLPESLARLAIEGGVRLYKRELAELEAKILKQDPHDLQ